MHASRSRIVRTQVFGAIIGVLLIGGVQPTDAATCGMVIGPGGGTVTLQDDLNCPGFDVSLRVVGPLVLDLNGHTLSCGGQRSSNGPTAGIHVIGGRAEIKNGAIADCDTGILLSEPGGGAHTLQRLTLRGHRKAILLRSTFTKISHNILHQNEAGVVVENVRNTVSDNTAFGNGVGFLLGTDASSNRMIGNTATGNEIGFQIGSDCTLGDECVDNAIIGNVAAENTRWGFFVPAGRSVLLGNRAKANGGDGFWIEGHGVLSGNKSKGNGGNGIVIRGHGGVVEANVVKNNGANGIVLEERRATSNTIVSNIVKGHLPPHVDLVDESFKCATNDNLWRDNNFVTKSGECLP